MHEGTQRIYEAVLQDSRGKARTQTEVAKYLGLKSSQVLKNWEERGPSDKGIIQVALITGCSVLWLRHNKGERWNEQHHVSDVNQAGYDLMSGSNVSPAYIGTRRIPLISYVQAGGWTEVINNYEQDNSQEWLLTDLELSDNAFSLEIKGDSMLPDFQAGDRVIIDPSITPRPGDFVVAKNNEEEATFKKYRPRGINDQGESIFELVPLNDDYPTLYSDREQIVIIGTMMEHRKYRR